MFLCITQNQIQQRNQSHTHCQGSDTRVRTQKNLAGFFGWAHFKKPGKKPPIFCI